ncbi:unnamed protein product, partial [Effrenium voratum]
GPLYCPCLPNATPLREVADDGGYHQMMNFDSFTEEEEVQRVLDHHGDLKEAVGAHLNFTETRWGSMKQSAVHRSGGPAPSTVVTVAQKLPAVLKLFSVTQRGSQVKTPNNMSTR